MDTGWTLAIYIWVFLGACALFYLKVTLDKLESQIYRLERRLEKLEEWQRHIS